MNQTSRDDTVEVLIIGAGFAGMYLLHRMREAGFSARVLEMAPDVGGTWYHNRYPGLRCDVESLEYQYSWSDALRNQWDWSERYPPQTEILAYARWVADQLELRRDIRFDTKVNSAQWNEAQRRWQVTDEGGQSWSARVLVLATGALSVPRYPNIPGLEAFAGDVVHTAIWPKEGVDVSGRRVGLIGTGSSGVQVATAIAPDVAHLSIFQRTPAYTIPARNRALSDADRRHFRENFAELNAVMNAASGGILNKPAQISALDVSPEEQQRMLWEQWDKGGSFRFTATFNDVRKNADSNRIVAAFVGDRIREQVKDPKTAELLCPTDFIAARRVCVDTGYYDIFNRDNVALVDVASDPIERFTGAGLRLASGAEHGFDTLILATGYDAMTGAILSLDLRGRDGVTIQEAWRDGPKTYLGLGVAGFPNLVTVTGPGSPSVLSNVLRSIEHHVDWITDFLTALRAKSLTRFEVQDAAQEAWVAHVRDVAESTLFTKAESWYMGADIPGKPRVFMPYAGGLPLYRDTCASVARDMYRGFDLS